jgi:hypothetical protein
MRVPSFHFFNDKIQIWRQSYFISKETSWEEFDLMEILRQQRKVNITILKIHCEIKKEKNHRTTQKRKSQN